MGTESKDGCGDIRVAIGCQNTEADGRRVFAARVQDPQRNSTFRWSGETREAMLAWLDDTLRAMLPAKAERRATVRAKQKQEPATKAAGHSSDYNLLIEPMDMEFVDLTLQESTGEDRRPGYLEASGRLRIYAEADGADNPALPFRVEFILVNLDNDESQTAAIENGSIHPGELAREIRRQFPIPGKGSYRVNAVVRKSPAGDVIASSQGPVLRVVE